MKTFLIATTVAILALVVLEITQSDAHYHGYRRCPQRNRPQLNTTAVTCDSRQMHRPMRHHNCARRCVNCYELQVLQRPFSCLVNGTCTCIAKPSAAVSTTLPSVSSTAAPATQQPTTAAALETQQPTTAAAPETQQPTTAAAPETQQPTTAAAPETQQPTTAAPPEPQPPTTVAEP